MRRHIPFAFAALALFSSASASHAAAPSSADTLPARFVEYFYNWKSPPKNLRVSQLRVLNAGGALRMLCGAYVLPGQDSRPFLVMGNASPSASAAWEPGSFPENDPLYPQLLDNLRLCQTLGSEVTTAQWNGGRAGQPAA